MSRIVVVGASRGGVQALHSLVAGLPEGFSAPILIVLHIGASRSILPAILNDADGTKAAFATQGEPLRDGRIYVAPPDHHMLLNDGHHRYTGPARTGPGRRSIRCSGPPLIIMGPKSSASCSVAR